MVLGKSMAKDGKGSGAARSNSSAAVRALLRPRAIAVVGASETEYAFGQRLLNSIANGGYKGAVYPVNPKYKTVAGLTCYPSLKDVPAPLDCVAFAVSEQRVEAGLREAAEVGARGAVVFSRGYEPPDAERPSVNDRWSAFAREAGIAMLGDNCMGFMNFVDSLKVSGNPPAVPPGYGRIGLLSHSGSTWSGLLGNQRQLAFNYALSVGRERVSGMADFIEFLLDQKETRVIGLVLEMVREPERFVAALARAQAQGVPVVALKLGRSEKGQHFALSHSGAVAGSDAAYQAVFDSQNVSRVYSLDEFTDTLELMSCDRKPTRPAIGVGTDSGGERQLISDIASDVGVPFTELSAATIKRLEDVLDPGLEAANPVDYWGDGRLYWEECLKILADDDGVGMVVMATNMVAGRRILKIASENIQNLHAYCPGKPAVMMGNLHSTIDRDEAALLRSKGIPVLMGTRTAMNAIRHFLDYHHRQAAAVNAAPAPAAPIEAVAAWRAKLAAPGPQSLDAASAMQMLADFGVPVIASRVVETVRQASDAATAMGYPVVLKTAAPGVLHKSDRNGVILNLADAAAVEAAASRLLEAFGPPLEIQKQAPAGTEVLLGMVNDPTFGPMVTVGLGGVFVEIFKDLVTLVPPVTEARAIDAIGRLKSAALLKGARGRPIADMAGLGQAVARFAAMVEAVGDLLAEMDVNPVIVGPDGAVAVDALVLRRAADK